MGGGTERSSVMAQAAGSIIGSAERLLAAGVLSFSGHGNMSQRAADDEILLTRRSSLRALGQDGLARVMLDGTVVEGTVEPANLEIVDMHTRVYRARADVGAIIHTHSPNVTAFALAHRPLPSRYESTIRFGIVDDIPVAPWGPRGSQQSVENILSTLGAHPGVRAVLLANHGLLAFGPDAADAAGLVIALEEAALMTLGAELLGGAQPFPPGALEGVRSRMSAFGPGGPAGSSG